MPPPRLHAPAEHGGVLATPPFHDLDAVLHANRACYAGHPLEPFRPLAVMEACAQARQFHQELGLEDLPHTGGPLIVTGHQPELFHPGVWVKNFAAAGLARRWGGTSLNLIIDNDLAKPWLRVPRRAAAPIRAVRVPFEPGVPGEPYEELRVRNEACFAAFPQVVREHLGQLDYLPLLDRLWRKVQSFAAVATGLGDQPGHRLAGARHLIEAEWGCTNLELPISRLCRTQAFGRFVWHLLTELPRFHAIHNQSLTAYRHKHRLRSANHPVPALAVDGDWLEAPLWCWRAGDTHRQRVFARQVNGCLELRLNPSTTARLPKHSPLQQPLVDLQGAGYRLRPRALTTTLFARLFLADLFIHGIGGAIYDELTDAIIRGFSDLEPPGFLTLSATFRLPFGRGPSHLSEFRALSHRVRDQWWNPDRYLRDETLQAPRARELCESKRLLASQQPKTADEKLARYVKLRAVGDELRKVSGREHGGAAIELAALKRRVEEEAVLADREYSFCLHPEAELRAFMQSFLTARNS
jgi:hypothetical protein